MQRVDQAQTRWPPPATNAPLSGPVSPPHALPAPTSAAGPRRPAGFPRLSRPPHEHRRRDAAACRLRPCGCRLPRRRLDHDGARDHGRHAPPRPDRGRASLCRAGSECGGGGGHPVGDHLAAARDPRPDIDRHRAARHPRSRHDPARLVLHEHDIRPALRPFLLRRSTPPRAPRRAASTSRAAPSRTTGTSSTSPSSSA